MTRKTPDYSIAVVDRTLDLLEALANSDGPVGVTQLAHRIDSNKSAVFRILSTLEQRGYVSKTLDEPLYQLGIRFAYLGSRSLRGLDIRSAARPVIEELHRRFGETVNLGVLGGTDVVYIDMIESIHGLRMAAQLGGRDPAYSTSIGKAILAHLPAKERERHLPSRFIPRTPKTVTDVASLDADLALARQRGVAEDVGENEIGARCFGAPIFDHTGSAVAGISVSLPESRLGGHRGEDIARAVRQAAARISAQIGGQVAAGSVSASDNVVEDSGIQRTG